MKRILLGVLALLGLLLAVAGAPNAQPKPIKLTLSPASTVPKADILKNLHSKCPNVTITLDSMKSDFMLEAGGWSGYYKFTLFKHGGEAVFSTSTSLLSNAVKDTCKFIATSKEPPPAPPTN
jgi:hypothetical protein